MAFGLHGYKRNFGHSKVTYAAANSELSDFKAKFSFPKATHSIAELHQDTHLHRSLQQLKDHNSGRPKVVLHGWIDSKPIVTSKKLCFGVLRDARFLLSSDCKTNSINTIQLVEFLSQDQINDSTRVQLRRLKQETCICVEGFLTLSKKRDAIVEVEVSKITILNTAGDLASQLKDTKDWDPKYRYLQLRLPEYQYALALRNKLYSAVRRVLVNDFTEIETPLLFRPTPEGAREFLVPSRANAGMTYALPQSPQQYKQLLMASGVHRYFQIAKCFRDEDLRQDRQPEFTQIDLEMAFAGATDVQDVAEDILTAAWLDIRGISLPKPFVRTKYIDAMKSYGIDKPDIRSDLKIIDMSEYATSHVHSDYPVFEILIVRKDAYPGGADEPPLAKPSSVRVPLRQTISKENPVIKCMRYFCERFKLSLVSDLTFVAKHIEDTYAIQEGDTIYGCTRQEFPFENPTPLGRKRLEILRADDGLDKFDVAPLWVVDFPLFTPVETGVIRDGCPEYDYSLLTSTHHPFTMPKLEYLEDVLNARNGKQVDPRRVLGQHYDIVVNGVEVGGGSTRVHDASLQRHIFSYILRIPGISPEIPKEPELNNPFSHLLNALAMGCPPHAGLAFGFDRLCAMLYGTESIRDIIAFPKTITGADPLVGSPSTVTDDQLSVYHLKKLHKKTGE
ncbi:tRNA synthetases class II-domain-containing protein [Dipodascopsis uninucleata]